jgi:2-C-methyl-D-erythritol 4-phosphate cytidylyltransferase/2-C-methyl-D-erythritol 2,4-cyclodiphosphate synthase
MSFDAIILAAGKSQRMSQNKLISVLGYDPLILHSVKVFEKFEEIKNIFVVSSDKQILSLLKDKDKISFVQGGLTRTESVYNALKKSKSEYVLIHDGARPFVSTTLIERVILATKEYNSAIPAIEVSDSLRLVENGRIVGYLNRDKYFFVQTPQGFHREQILFSYNQIGNESYTDDSEVYGKFVEPPYIVKGERQNIKITYDRDLLGINAKVGIGYDIHKLKKGIPLILGGEKVPFEKGLEAHSDGDVLIHAIMDSLLGAASEGDIGIHFPPFDKKYQNISSMKLLKKVYEICSKKGLKINNISAVIIAEKPKLSPYIKKMCENISNLLNISLEKINISATTAEGIGEIGGENAIACMAVCSCF